MTTVEVLTPWVERVVQEVLGADHVHRDDDGDIPMELDRTVMYVRLGDGPNDVPRLRVFGPLLREVTPTPELYEKLNELNRDCSYLRFYFHNGMVWAAMECVAESFRAEDLANVLAAAGFYAERVAGLIGIPEAKTWREPASGKSSDTTSNAPVDADQQELSVGTGPAAHVEIPSKVLPDDPSPADGATNLRLGYL